MKNIIFYVGYEDELSLALIQKIFSQLNHGDLIGAKFPGKGAGYLKKNIKSFNELAKGIPFLLLTDLDNDECAPTKIRDWIKVPLNPNFLFRIAVRESESWVLICFVQSEWDLYKATGHSESLKRMIGRLQSFIPYLNSRK